MPVDFQEFKSKQKPINSTHKFPLLRLMFIAMAAFCVYWTGLGTQFVDFLLHLGDDNAPVEQNWDDRCRLYNGSPLELHDGLVKCSWQLDDSTDVSRIPTSFLRYVAEIRKSPLAKLHWVAPKEHFAEPKMVMLEDSSVQVYFRYTKSDSSQVWVSKSTGCRFPGVCPHQPLEWAALPIPEDFDFEGQESLLAMDVFRGIGEAPVHPILSGKVLATGKDSLGYFVDLDHGYNVSSRTSGLGSLNKSLMVGSEVSFETRLGSLPPQDSATFCLTIRQNGLFVRWNEFYGAAHPVTREQLESYEKALGL